MKQLLRFILIGLPGCAILTLSSVVILPLIWLVYDEDSCRPIIEDLFENVINLWDWSQPEWFNKKARR